MHGDASGAGVFARDRQALAGRGVEGAFDRIDAGVGRRDHHPLAPCDAVSIGGDAGRGCRSRLTGDSDGGAAIELIMRAVTECAHAFAKFHQRGIVIEDLGDRPAPQHIPKIVVDRKVRNARRRACVVTSSETKGNAERRLICRELSSEARINPPMRPAISAIVMKLAIFWPVVEASVSEWP